MPDPVFGDAGRFLDAFDLQADRPGRLHALVDVVRPGRHEAPAHAAARAQRMREPDLVEAVVDADIAKRQHDVFFVALAEQRQRRQTVCNGAADRGLPGGAIPVDVNPLRVAGGFGGQVDALLCEDDPACHDHSAADLGAELFL